MNFRLVSLIPLLLASSMIGASDKHPVNITHDLPYVDLNLNGNDVRIERSQDTENMVDLDFALTSRACPPYCVQPMNLAPGVETLGELELLDYLQRMAKGDDSILVIDSRTGEWLSRGMIPGAISIPWSDLSTKTASYKSIAETLGFNWEPVSQMACGILKMPRRWCFIATAPGVASRLRVSAPCSRLDIQPRSSSGTEWACRAGPCLGSTW
jgi:hypothetical protein